MWQFRRNQASISGSILILNSLDWDVSIARAAVACAADLKSLRHRRRVVSAICDLPENQYFRKNIDLDKILELSSACPMHEERDHEAGEFRNEGAAEGRLGAE